MDRTVCAGAAAHHPWLSLPLYRWIAVLLLIPLIFGVAALSTRALSRVARPVLRRRRAAGDRKLVSRGPLRLLVLALFFYVASFFGLSLATRHFWQRVAETLMSWRCAGSRCACWISWRS